MPREQCKDVVNKLYKDIHCLWCLPSLPNKLPSMYSGTAKVILMTDTSLREPATTVITDKIMLYENTMERHKYKDHNMKSLMDRYTYKVPGSISLLRSFPRHSTSLTEGVPLRTR